MQYILEEAGSEPEHSQKNPGEDKLLEAIDYVHLHGRKLYLTVNTLMKEQEIKELFEYLLPYYRQGLDAVIVQDLGVLSFVREYFPDLPFMPVPDDHYRSLWCRAFKGAWGRAGRNCQGTVFKRDQADPPAG